MPSGEYLPRALEGVLWIRGVFMGRRSGRVLSMSIVSTPRGRIVLFGSGASSTPLTEHLH
jgi:hypothetical protein